MLWIDNRDADSNNNSDESKETADSNNNSDESKEKSEDAVSTPPEEDIEYLKTLRLNVNVFLPDMRSFEGIDEVAAEQIKMDEKMVNFSTLNKSYNILLNTD